MVNPTNISLNPLQRRKNMRFRLISLALLLAAAPWLFGQAGESRGSASTTISGKKLTVDYGQPALKGRSFAELVKQLPSDRMWRAGSGIVTTLTTEADLMIGGKKVAAGKYSLYVHCPESGDYSLVLNSDQGQPLGKVWAAAPPAQAKDPYPSFDYTKEIAAKEVLRAPMKKTSAAATDILAYTVKPAAGGATLTLAWGDQAWTVDIRPAN